MKIRKYLPIIGILIFIFLLLKLNLSEIFKEIVSAEINFLLIAIFFVFMLFITQTLKWFAIARIQTTNVPFFKAFKINLICLFYSTITPSKIGGIIRAEYLKKYNNNNLGKGVSNFVLDKILDLCSLVFLIVIFSFVFKDIISLDYLYYSLSILLLLFTFLLILQSKSRSKIILKIFYKKLVPKKMKKKLKEGFYSFYENMPRKRYFILFFLLNLLNWVVLYSITYFAGVSLGINISFFYFLAILPITTLITLIPITIGGIGTKEASMISLFALLGIGATKVFSMALIVLFISEIIPTIIGSFLIFKDKEKI